MTFDPIAARYAQAAFEAATEQHEVDETLRELTQIGALISGSAGLRQLLRNPDVDPPDKVGVLERSLQQSWSGLVRAFIEMTVAMGRAELLPEIVEAFQAAVDAARGRLRAVVRSAHPLSQEMLAQLRSRLEQHERKTIELDAELAPELIGGVQVILGHRVFDGSVKRQLSDLRERLLTVRVH